MKNSQKAFENWLFVQPFFDAESYAIDSSVYATEKEAWNSAIEFSASRLEIDLVQDCTCQTCEEMRYRSRLILKQGLS